MTGESRATTWGWTLLRIGVGVMFVRFGWGKINGDAASWAKLGAVMKSVYGIGVYPAFWGFMAALAEFGGGLALVLGLLVRPFAAMLAFTMITASLMLIQGGADLAKYGHAADMAIVFVALTIGGGGPFALGARLPGLRGHWFS